MMPRHIINTAADRPSQNAIISSPISGDVFTVDSYRCDKVGCLTVSFISYDKLITVGVNTVCVLRVVLYDT